MSFLKQIKYSVLKAVSVNGFNVSSSITKRLRRIHNAWQFRFALNLVATAQWFRFGGRVVHHLTRR
ncbi:hypothetical protein CGH10_23905 [Vibrio parahaemolyticus]|nr:hypothetical protein [Vibrio parahaemolyticus]TOP72926.1 hypothetical protein CGH10_23905 [Vibrio parahaemolyticus]